MPDGISPIQVKLDAKPLADLGNNIVNKLAQGIGWIASPKGNKKDLEEARDYFVREVEEKSDIPATAKAMLISNAYKAVKEYQNQNDILNFAVKQLDEKIQTEKVDDDWLLHFFDKAKYVSKDQFKLIWGNLLANECKKPDSVPIALIETLSGLSNKAIQTFRTVCNCTFIGNYDEPTPFIKTQRYMKFYKSIGIDFFYLNELDSRGLIRFNPMRDFAITDEALTGNAHVIFSFGRVKIEVHERGLINIGEVLFTEEGKALFNAITPEPIADLLPLFYQYLESRKYRYKVISS